MYKSLFKSIKAIIKSLLTVLKYTCEKSKNHKSPKEKIVKPENFRGKIKHKRDENGNLLCNGCGLCQKVCPCKDLIKITCMPDEDSKISVIYETDNAQCIFCGNCVEYCPQKALEFTDSYEPAVTNKNDLKTEFKNS